MDKLASEKEHKIMFNVINTTVFGVAMATVAMAVAAIA